MTDYGMEIVRYGRYAVLDRGVPPSPSEQAEYRPRYAVVEHDDLGPILRAGPFHGLAIAVERCQQFAFRFDMSRPEERDHA